MSEEKQNKTYYQETFREVHAPQALAERMSNMQELMGKKKSGRIVKRLVAAAAVAVLVFAGSNGIAYAMTGSTWFATLEELLIGQQERIVLEDDRVYIVDGDIRIDVTEELQEKGQASGTYEKDGVTKDYCVVSPNGQMVLDIRYYYEGMDENTEGLKPVGSGYVLAGTPTPTPEP